MKRQQLKPLPPAKKPGKPSINGRKPLLKFDNVEDILVRTSLTEQHLAQLPIISDNITKSEYGREFKATRKHIACEEYDLTPVLEGMQKWSPQFIKAYLSLVEPGQFKQIITPTHVFAILNELFSNTWEGMEKYRLLRHVDDAS